MAGLLVLLLLCIHPAELATESLTLTTYYPSPYGVYSELRSTDNAYLAYDSGIVRVGSETVGTAGSDKLAVSGQTYLDGFVDARRSMDVGSAGGMLRVGGGASVGSGYFSKNPPENGMIVADRMGIGLLDPASPTAGFELEVVGDIKTNQVRVDGSACGQVTTPSEPSGDTTINSTPCGGGQYATFFPGYYRTGSWNLSVPRTYYEFTTNGVSVNVQLHTDSSVVFYCCPQP